MKVSTTSFLLASLYGSAWAAPIGGDLVGSTLQSVTGPGDTGNVGPVNDLTGNVGPVNDLAESLTSAVGQSDSIVGRDAPIDGDLVGSVLQSATGTGVTGGTGKVGPVNDLTESLTGAVGQPGSIVGRDGEQKASAVLPKYTFVATDHTADVDIRADATNVDARNLHAEEGIVSQLADVDAKTAAHPFDEDKTPVEIYLDTLVDASNRDITANSVAHQTAGTVADQTVDAEADPNVHARNLDANFKGMGQLVGNDANVKVHPFKNPPAKVNANVVADAGGATDSV
ncbi:hypothetical protein NHJ13734_007471 [Beauveria thailandica]